MPKNVNELNLQKQQVETDWDRIPEEFGPIPDPPPAGKDYRFALPKDMKNLWDVIAGNDQRGERVVMVFDDNNPLLIDQAPAGLEEWHGVNIWARISNLERNRGKEKIPVSDMAYLIRVLDPAARPKTNQDYVAVMMKQGGKKFVAALEYQANCREDKGIYIQDDNGALVQGIVDGQPKMGCGSRVYFADWPRVEGAYPVQVQCPNPECGALLRARVQLARFRAAQPQAQQAQQAAS